MRDARQDLYDIIRRVFRDGEVPADMVVVLFCMIYKGPHKGFVNTFEAYMPVGLMRHAWKVIDVIFMEELVEDTEMFLSHAQDGSRASRGARGPILRVRMFSSTALAIGMEGVLCLLDYSGAFDATAHSFMDVVMRKSGARV